MKIQYFNMVFFLQIYRMSYKYNREYEKMEIKETSRINKSVIFLRFLYCQTMKKIVKMTQIKHNFIITVLKHTFIYLFLTPIIAIPNYLL